MAMKTRTPMNTARRTRRLLCIAFALASTAIGCEGADKDGSTETQQVALTDCVYATIPDVQSSADCACPQCPHEVGALTRSELDERRRRFRKFCGEWAEHNPCPLGACKQPQPLTLTEGRCDTASR
jgi:hypothetical protein